MLSAIEAYNKPDHKYREETFSILALNAWELLMKSKLLFEKNNNLRKLYIYEKKELRDGIRSSRKYIKRNRSGNPLIIGIIKTINVIESEGYADIPELVKRNIDALIEVRDNAVHLINRHPEFSKIIQEIGTATVQNYLLITKKWFNFDFSQYNVYLMPIAFYREFPDATIVNLSSEESNLANYISSLYQDIEADSSEGYAVTLELDVTLKRSDLPTATRLTVGNDPDAVPVILKEEDIRKHYPWDYRQLTEKLRARYSDFSQNQKYHDIRKMIQGDKRYIKARYLDPENPRSSKKDFYSPHIINEFDKHYQRG